MYKNKKITGKLILSFILVALIANIAGCLGLSMLKTQDAKYNNVLITNGFAQSDIGNYNTYLNKGGSLVRDIILLTDTADIKKIQKELAEVDKLTAQYLLDVRIHCQSMSELLLLEKIDEFTLKYEEGRSLAIELALRNKDNEALNVLLNEANPCLDECMNAGQELMELNAATGNMETTQLAVSLNISMITMILIMTGSIIAAIIFACIVSRNISKSMDL